MITHRNMYRNPDYIAALTDAAPPRIVGMIYAQKGEPPVVEIYDKDGDRAEFLEGYHGEKSAMYRAILYRTLTVEEMAAHNEDYREWQLDVDWMRGGC